MVQRVCVRSFCVSAAEALWLLISAVACSPGSVSFVHSKSAEHWDINPKLLGAVISCSFPSFKNYCHCALSKVVKNQPFTLLLTANP